MRRVLVSGLGLLLCLGALGCSSSDAASGSTPGADSGVNSSSGGGGSSGASGGSNGGDPGTGGASGGAGGKGGGGTGGTSDTGGAQGSGGAGTGGGSGGDAGIPTKPGYVLSWHDEFDAADGTLPDSSKWVFETGGNGFGNNELEYYTDRAENASMDGAGHLVITARAEAYMGRDYTSARLKTQGKFEQSLGRFEARIRIPKGQGIWPAFWMLGNDIPTAGWPTCGEIDIMENIGKEPTKVHGTIHGPGYSGGSGIGAAYSLPGNGPFADDFHVYAVEWDAQEIRWYVDDANYETHTSADVPAGKKWVYDHPFFILLNVAVGGQWPGNPDGTTTFPQEMVVDYVRVFSHT